MISNVHTERSGDCEAGDEAGAGSSVSLRVFVVRELRVCAVLYINHAVRL